VNEFISWLSKLFSGWKFWIVVAPWDIAVRIRLGKNASALGPGLHLRIPTVDEITMVNTRLRVCATPTQALPGSHPSKVRTVGVAVGFRIVDPLASMLAYSQPEPALSAFVQAHLATHSNGELSQDSCVEALRAEFPAHGIAIDFAYFVENVEVRTYRVIGGQNGVMWSGVGPPAVQGQSHSFY
jgi:SPFH domain/Band 7 family protein